LELVEAGNGLDLKSLEAEANAWLWALEHTAVEPTVATKRSISRRLRGYLEKRLTTSSTAA